MNASNRYTALRFNAPPQNRLSLWPAALVAAVLVSVAPGVAAFGYSPPTDGLVAWWNAEGGAMDVFGGHDGTASGAVSYTAGPVGEAFSIGNDGRIFVPDSPAFQLTNSLSIGLWMKPTPDSWVAFFRGDTRSGFDPYAISMARDGTARVGLQLTDANNDNSMLFAPIAGYDVWQQVTATFDGSTGTRRIFINGQLMAEDTTTIRPFAVLDPSLTPGLGIGNVESFYNFPFQGGLDEVVLYNRALNPGEVALLVPEPAAGHLLLCGGLAVLWRVRRRASAGW